MTAGPVEEAAQPWALLCADGTPHAEHGEVQTGSTRQCAVEAGEFMDEPRPDSPWRCGPHRAVSADEVSR